MGCEEAVPCSFEKCNLHGAYLTKTCEARLDRKQYIHAGLYRSILKTERTELLWP